MKPHRRRAHGFLIPLALALTLGACSSEGGPNQQESPASSAPSLSASEKPTGQPSESAPESSTSAPVASESPAASGEKVSKKRIQAAIDDFVAKHKGAQEIPGSDIKPSELDEVSKGVKVEPKACRDAYLSFQDPDLPQTGKTHVAMHRNTGSGDIAWLSISEFDSPDDARKMMTHHEDSGSAQCERMEIETNGMKLTVQYITRTPPELASIDRVSASTVVETIPSGASTTTHSVVALKGNLMVLSSLSSVEDNFTPEQADAIVRDALQAIDQ